MENSESGAPIYQHEHRERDFEPAHGDSENIERISDHIEKYIGPVANVFHELVSDLVHIDVHVVEPTTERPFYTLITSGMSDKPMSAPEEIAELSYSELMIALPPDWPLTEEAFKDEANYWPIRVLKQLARFPHEYQTWLWAMHTVPNGNPPEPFASNTAMTGSILLPPLTAPSEFYELVIDDQKTIHFHCIVPLHDDEMELKLKSGGEALFDGFDAHQVSELLDPGRPSTVKKKRSWFGFGK